MIFLQELVDDLRNDFKMDWLYMILLEPKPKIEQEPNQVKKHKYFYFLVLKTYDVDRKFRKKNLMLNLKIGKNILLLLLLHKIVSVIHKYFIWMHFEVQLC